MMSQRAINISGLRVGKLTVLDRSVASSRNAHWRCSCECGNECVIRGSLLRSGVAKCCGCSTRFGNQHTPLEVRFWRSVDRRGDDECWPWIGRISKGPGQGYGLLNSNGRETGAHRVSWEIANGRPLGALHIDHLCCNKWCVNPRHLDPCTTQENTKRWSDRLTHCKRGHEYSDKNTRIDKHGKRHCRVCELMMEHQRKDKRRIAALRAKAEP